jgi:hypothetical protein
LTVYRGCCGSDSDSNRVSIKYSIEYSYQIVNHTGIKFRNSIDSTPTPYIINLPTITQPKMSGSTLPKAFKLVRQLLSERPRAFQEILRDGLPSAPTATATVKGKGKLVAGESHVPEGHPFVSAS